jgi:hypothetical protein
VLIYTNDDWEGRTALGPSESPTIELLDHCPETYSGSFSGQVPLPGAGTLKWAGNVTFATPAPSFGLINLTATRLLVTSGSVSWSISGVSAGCSLSGSGSFILPPTSSRASYSDLALFSNGTYEANIMALPPDYATDTYILPYKMSCPDTPTEQNNAEWPAWLQTQQFAEPTGSTLSGSYYYAGATFNWDLHPSTGNA